VACLFVLTSFFGWIGLGRAQAAPPYAVNLASAERSWDRTALPHLDTPPSRRLYVTRFDRGGKAWHRLRLGMFETRAAAETAKAAVGARFPGAWVTPVTRREHDLFVSKTEAAWTMPLATKPAPTVSSATKSLATKSPAAAPMHISIAAPRAQLAAASPVSIAGDSLALSDAGAKRVEPAAAPPQLAQRRGNKAPPAPSNPTVSHDFDGRVEGGYDSNPLKLNSNVSDAVFGRLKLGYELTYQFAKRQRFFVGGELVGRRYSVDEADRDRGYVKIGFRDSSIKLGEGRLRTTVGARYGYRSLTFVDQFTGQEQTESGVPIGTRFDANWYEMFAAFRAPVTKTTTLILDGGVKFKDYRDDFTNLGLDRLDYTEYAVEPGLRQKFSGGLSARITLPMSYRLYDDRRAEDIVGNDVPGSDLRYFYYGIDARIGDPASKSMRWTVGADAERRVDNESGFNDRNTYGLYGRATFGRRDGNRLGVNVKVSLREYDEIDTLAIDAANDGGRVKQGVRARLTYTNPINLYSGLGVDLFLSASGEAFDNSDGNFTYSRYTANAGVRKKF